MGIEAVTGRRQTTAARLGQHDHRARLARDDRVGQWQAGGRDAGDVDRPAGLPSGLRSFDPARAADLEYRAWVGYYQHDWRQALMAFAGLIRMGFGMDWCRTLHAAWLALRAIQLWAPLPDSQTVGLDEFIARWIGRLRRRPYTGPPGPPDRPRARAGS
jgi:hypothetical protein